MPHRSLQEFHDDHRAESLLDPHLAGANVFGSFQHDGDLDFKNGDADYELMS